MNKLLIVDNSIVIINLLKDLFSQKNDFKVYVAQSFEEVELLLSKHTFFASISNVVLQDALNGELLELLSEKNIPTVVLSSKIDDDTLSKIKNNNVVDYILKDSIHELTAVYNLIELLVFMEGIEVLVVDDSVLNASLIKNNLDSLLLSVHLAKNGLDALKILEKNQNISMIITDYHMDEMNGLELLKELKNHESYTKIPVLAMSSENDNDLKIKLFKNGAVDFLLKPILEEELKSKVINIFQKMKQVKDIKLFDKVFDENVISSSTDSKGIIKYVSQAFCDIAGYEKDELIGQPHNVVRHPEMPSSTFEDLWSTVKSGQTWMGEVKNIRRDGTFYWVKAVIEPNYNSKGEIIGFTSIRQDITDKKRIYELSITDGLTSLYNRRYFNDFAPSFITETLEKNQTFAFALLDIDNFKKYNDTYGHQEGDNVLINVSKSLKACFSSENEMVFRLGGEEFGILISVSSYEEVKQRIEEARQCIESLQIEHNKNNPYNVITASFGVSVLENKEALKSLAVIYKQTDDYLYQAKESGRNRVSYEEN